MIETNIRLKKLSLPDKIKLFAYFNLKQPSFYLGLALGISIMLIYHLILF